MKEARCGENQCALNGKLTPPLLELEWQLKRVFTWTVIKKFNLEFVLTHSLPCRFVNGLNGARSSYKTTCFDVCHWLENPITDSQLSWGPLKCVYIGYKRNKVV
ncbi:hypothetical protein K443DRAFT_412542 [Laccaria amethystina LaAM-08-1]|uniref:Uncharacterized protein n=1 Tax=Laccaria amethystina LaAM-08-1 TaxID=1095629 RepID=A0A0C9WXX7_9AGAR|nr:hypothetical protein K443DRAFT_412542 [Laccaria amethystina LaAM-08-1]